MIRIATSFFLCLRWFTETSFCEINPAVLGSQMKICDHQCLFLSAVSLDFSTHPPLKGKGENPLHGTTSVSPKEQFETVRNRGKGTSKICQKAFYWSIDFRTHTSGKCISYLENWIWHEHAKTTDCYSEVLCGREYWIYTYTFFLI